MTRPFLLDPEFLKAQAHKRYAPEFATEIKEMELAHRHADAMLADGRLTKAEHEDFEAHLYSKFIDALPVGEFQELMKNGGMEDLQALAGHDGTRDVGDVEDARKAIEAKVKGDALDNAWAAGDIDNKYFAEQSQRLDHDLRRFDENRDDQVAAEDYDGAAMKYFVERNDDPGHDRDLAAFLTKKYGNDPGDKRGFEEPVGQVEHEIEIQMPSSGAKIDLSGITDLDA